MDRVMRCGVVGVVCVYAFLASVLGGEPITVTGDADVRVVPDEVILTFGVETDDKDLGTAKAENDERVKQVLQLAKEYGIEPKHVQTDYISIEPRYDHPHAKRVFLGYLVRKSIVFTLRDTSKFEALLTSALDAGANYVHGISFRTTELRKHRDEARALAIRAAKEKAEALAKELDLKVGKPRSIREDRLWWASGYNSWWGQRGGYSVAQNVVQNIGTGAMDAGDSVALGQITVHASVTVTFNLE